MYVRMYDSLASRDSDDSSSGLPPASTLRLAADCGNFFDHTDCSSAIAHAYAAQFSIPAHWDSALRQGSAL